MKCYLWKICVVALLFAAVALDAVSAKKKANKYEGDFEFVDEVSVFLRVLPCSPLERQQQRKREAAAWTPVRGIWGADDGGGRLAAIQNVHRAIRQSFWSLNHSEVRYTDLLGGRESVDGNQLTRIQWWWSRDVAVCRKGCVGGGGCWTVAIPINIIIIIGSIQLLIRNKWSVPNIWQRPTADNKVSPRFLPARPDPPGAPLFGIFPALLLFFKLSMAFQFAQLLPIMPHFISGSSRVCWMSLLIFVIVNLKHKCTTIHRRVVDWKELKSPHHQRRRRRRRPCLALLLWRPPRCAPVLLYCSHATSSVRVTANSFYPLLYPSPL